MAASKLSHKPYVFSVKDGMYDCESCVPKITVKADGQDQPVSGQPYDMLSVKLADPNTLQTAAKKAGKPTFEQTRTLSQDGKTLTVATTTYPADGSQPFKTEVKIHPGLEGARRSRTRFPDPGELTASVRIRPALPRRGRYRVIPSACQTPTGESWEAKFDGKDYPVKGVYANETVSVKKLGDRAMEVTEKRDGKVYSVDKVTVAADGKKMTTVNDNKWTGRVSTYIDEKQ